MIRLAVALAMSLAVSVSAWWTPPYTIIADPADDSCPLAMAMVCKVLPIAPGLDDDVDLTKLPSGDPRASDPAPMPQRTADICGHGCI